MGSYKNIPYRIDTFTEATKKDINEQLTKTKKSSNSNLTKKELEVLEQLKRRNHIIIASTDKGGAIVIQDVKQYINPLTTNVPII